MDNNNQQHISSRWSGYRKIWWFITIVLLILLLALWLLGYGGPGSKNCPLPANNVVEEKLIDNPQHLQRIGVLEKENAKIAGLLQRIKELEGAGTGNLVTADGFAPVINLNNGAVVQYLSVGDNYSEAGATAIDNVDGILSVTSRGSVDTTKAGSYTIYYSVTDAAGNTTETTRTIIVGAALPAPEAKLYFKSDRADSPTTKGLSLDAVVAYLKKYPKSTVVISGFHDATGILEKNQDLAKRRSITVSGMLQQQGIPLERISMDKPTQTTGTGNLAEARRVEVKIKN